MAYTNRANHDDARDNKAVLARMVELRGVEAAFPFYGIVTLQDGKTYSHELIANHGVLVRPELLTALNVSFARPAPPPLSVTASGCAPRRGWT